MEVGATAAPNPGTSSTKAIQLSILVTGICWGMVVLEGYDLIAFGSVLPVLTADKASGFNSGNVGWVASAIFVGSTVGALASGYLADRYGRRPVAIGSLIIFSIFTMGCGLADGPLALGILRFLAGIGIGAVVPSASALTLEFAVPELRTVFYTVMLSGVPVGGILAAVSGLTVIPQHGWRWVFFIAIIPPLIALPFLFKQLPESPSFLDNIGRHEEAEAFRAKYDLPSSSPHVGPEHTHHGAGRKAQAQAEAEAVHEGIFSPRYRLATWMFGLASFCGLLTWFGLGTWLPGIMRELGYDLAAALTFLLVLNIGAVIGSLFIAYATDRYGSKVIVVPTYLVLGIALLVLLIKMPQLPLMIFIVLAGIGGHGGQILVNRFVSRGYFPVNRARGLGWSLGFGRLGTVVGPIVIGYVVAGGRPEWGFIFFATAALLAALFLFLVPKTPAMEMEEQ